MSASSYMQPDPNLYQVTITGASNNGEDVLEVVAWTPETFSLSTHAHFEQKLSGGLGQLLQTVGSKTPLVGSKVSAIGGIAHNLAAPLIGVSDVTQAQTLRTWTGSDTLTMQIPLLFNSDYNEASQVSQSIINLLKFPQPYNSNIGGLPLLSGPGPSFFGAISGGTKEQVSLRIGRFLYIPFILIESVNVEIDNMMHKSGGPISAKADITVSTPFTPLRSDLDKWFRLGATGESQNAAQYGNDLRANNNLQGIAGLLEKSSTSLEDAFTQRFGPFNSASVPNTAGDR